MLKQTNFQVGRVRRGRRRGRSSGRMARDAGAGVRGVAGSPRGRQRLSHAVRVQVARGQGGRVLRQGQPQRHPRGARRRHSTARRLRQPAAARHLAC